MKDGQWWDKSITLVEGCSPVSAGCTHCWSAGMANRFRPEFTTNGHFNGKVVCREDRLENILKRKKPTRWTIWNDLPLAPYEFWVKVMTVIKQCKQHTFQILTKRPEILLQYCTSLYEHGSPPENLWLGVTVCVPDEKHKIDTLRKIPAAVRFLSIEPCLADMGELNLEGIGWVIIGGESGPGARYCPVENIRDVVNQCKAAGVKAFVKQIHSGTPSKFKLVKNIKEFPKELQIRQFPVDK